jgi:hypothetical protein
VKQNTDDELKKVLIITDTNFEDCIFKQASLFYYYSEKYNKKLNEKNVRKLELDIAYANLYKVYKKKMLKSDDKAPTEKTIASAVETNESYIDKQRLLIDTQSLADKYGSLKDALKQKKDMLQLIVQLKLSQLGGGVRQDYKSDVVDGIRQELRAKTKKAR